MLAVLLIAASLAAQAWIFRDTPGHPADPCARVEDNCPEAGLNALLARQAEALKRQRTLARGEAYPEPVESRQATAAAPAAAVHAAHAAPSPAAPEDSLQAEACRLPDSGD